MSLPLSVLVPTLDEELNLPDCLDSLQWADEVFVVDSFSKDRTLEIARARGAHVVQHAFESYSRQKNWALDNLPFRNEWVLIVDADERVTPELRCEVEQVLVSSTAAFEGYYVNRRFIFLGTWVRHAGWYPSWNLRLFRHRLGRYDDREVHEHIVLNGGVGYLRNDLLHFDKRGLEAYISATRRIGRGCRLACLLHPFNVSGLCASASGRACRSSRWRCSCTCTCCDVASWTAARAWRCVSFTPFRSSWSG